MEINLVKEKNERDETREQNENFCISVPKVVAGNQRISHASGSLSR